MPEHGLLPVDGMEFTHTSVGRKAFAFADKGQGVSTSVLRCIVALPTVLDVEVTQRLIFVYTVTPNALASSLYTTIKSWKEEPCSVNLMVRSFKKLPARKRLRRRRQKHQLSR